VEIIPSVVVECNIVSDIEYQLSRITRMEFTKHETKENSRPLDTEHPMSDLSHPSMFITGNN
jgi:hypothetical protein